MPDGGEDAAMPAMPPARWQDWSGTGDPPVAPDLAAYQSMQMRWLNLRPAPPVGNHPDGSPSGHMARTLHYRCTSLIRNSPPLGPPQGSLSHSLSLTVSRTLQEDLA